VKIGRPIAFVVLAFLIGAIISQGSFAFADDSATNPFRAIWEAIGELQTRTDSLQAQIDELKTQGVAVSSTEQVEVSASDTSLAIDVWHDDFQTVIDVVATNSGGDNAVGVKILTFYQMSVLDVTFIDGAQCTDQARGIIECYVGTIESGNEARVTIYATPAQLGEQAIITADASSITKDSNPANNHAELVFITSEEPVALPPVQVEEEEPEEQPSEEAPFEEQPSESSGEEQGSEEQTTEEQPSEGEQGAEEQAGEEQPSEQTEQTGEEAGDEQSSGEESSESGNEQSSEQGSESSSEQGEESSSDQGSESGDSGDAGSSDGSEGDSSGDSGSSDSGSSEGGSSDSSSSDGGSSDGGSSGDSGSDGGSSDGGSSGGDSGSSGGSSGDSGSSG
jgi:hypothetical protein